LGSLHQGIENEIKRKCLHSCSSYTSNGKGIGGVVVVDGDVEVKVVGMNREFDREGNGTV
jgi:hypothetical protein